MLATPLCKVTRAGKEENAQPYHNEDDGYNRETATTATGTISKRPPEKLHYLTPYAVTDSLISDYKAGS